MEGRDSSSETISGTDSSWPTTGAFLFVDSNLGEGSREPELFRFIPRRLTSKGAAATSIK